MAHVVSRRPLTAEARVSSSLVFPCQYIIPPSLSKTHIIWGMRNMLA
jgi:hypothetical protein